MATASFRLSSLTEGFKKFFGGVKILGGDSKNSEEFLKIWRGFKYVRGVSQIIFCE